MKIGYARCSTKQQDLQLQIDALEKYGCDKIFKDQGISGTTRNRPELNKCLSELKCGDTLVLYKLDRLFRSTVHFAQVAVELKNKGIGLVSITQAFDTNSSTGRLMMNILSSFSEFERDMISERTAAGMQSAIKQGRKMGPKFKEGPVSIRTMYRRKKNVG